MDAIKLDKKLVRKIIPPIIFDRLVKITNTCWFHHLFLEGYYIGVTVKSDRMWDVAEMQGFYITGKYASIEEAYNVIANIPDDVPIIALGTKPGYRNLNWRYRFFLFGDKIRLLDTCCTTSNRHPGKIFPIVTLDMVEEAMPGDRENITIWGDVFNCANFKRVYSLEVFGRKIIFEKKYFLSNCHRKIPDDIFQDIEKISVGTILPADVAKKYPVKRISGLKFTLGDKFTKFNLK